MSEIIIASCACPAEDMTRVVPSISLVSAIHGGIAQTIIRESFLSATSSYRWHVELSADACIGLVVVSILVCRPGWGIREGYTHFIQNSTNSVVCTTNSVVCMELVEQMN